MWQFLVPTQKMGTQNKGLDRLNNFVIHGNIER